MFFFAEDAQHVAHAWRALNGMPHYFWKNFYGIWMNDPSMFLFYRPLPELTFGTDFWLWGINPVGYHITNFAWHQLAAITLFLFLSRLLLPYGMFESRLISLMAAGVFTSSPLNAEAVNWLVNRSDLICMVFMMLSLRSYVKQLTSENNWHSMPVALLFMLLALLCKESAIAIPPLALAVFAFLKANHLTLDTLKVAAKSTMPFWLLLALYIVFRFVILGGPGGYTGSTAISFAENTVTRLTSISSWILCFYPVNLHSQSDSRLIEMLITTLSLLYGALVVILFGRLFLNYWSSKSNHILLFSLSAFVIALAPTLQCWHVTSGLLSTRFMYLPSAFFGLFVASLVIPIGACKAKTSIPMWITGTCWSLLFITVSCCLHCINNEPWLTASDSLQKLTSSLRESIKTMAKGDKATVLNLPLDERFALTMYSWEHLAAHLMPPFSGTKEDISNWVVATQPYWIASIKNSSRIEAFINAPGNHGLVWDSAKKSLVPCAQGEFPELGVSLDEARCAVMSNAEKGREPVAVYDLESCKVDPRLAQLVAITLSPRNLAPLAGSEHPLSCMINWTSRDCPVILPSSTMFKFADHENQNTIIFPVSEQVRWRLSPQSLQRLMVSPCDGYEVASVELLNDKKVVPQLQIKDASIAPNGVFELRENLTIQFNCSHIPGATSTLVEVSEPNAWLHQLHGTYRDTRKSKHSSIHWTIPETTGYFTVPNNLVRGKQYDVRVFAASGENILGFSSDPVVIEVK